MCARIDPSSEAIGELRQGMKDVQSHLSTIENQLEKVVSLTKNNFTEIKVMKAKSTLLGGVAAAVVSLAMYIITLLYGR